MKALAFYLPQYYPTPYNSKWWGKGFTDWDHVRNARPKFPGHSQPKIPYGEYDLRNPYIQDHQEWMAWMNGISGFVYYHYWFEGEQLLEVPLRNKLENKALWYPFCLCWANHDWVRERGSEITVLKKQTYSDKDHEDHVRTLEPILKDPRYFRVNGKPLFLIFEWMNVPDPYGLVQIWRKESRSLGIDLYLVAVETVLDRDIDPTPFGYDAKVIFQPSFDLIPNLKRTKYQFAYEYGDAVSTMKTKPRPYKWFPTVFPGWDNTARHPEAPFILINQSPEKYEGFLRGACEDVLKEIRSESEQLVFINAWNEWAEGCYLESDSKHQDAFLKATRRMIRGS